MHYWKHCVYYVIWGCRTLLNTAEETSSENMKRKTENIFHCVVLEVRLCRSQQRLQGSHFPGHVTEVYFGKDQHTFQCRWSELRGSQKRSHFLRILYSPAPVRSFSIESIELVHIEFPILSQIHCSLFPSLHLDFPKYSYGGFVAGFFLIVLYALFSSPFQNSSHCISPLNFHDSFRWGIALIII